MSTQIKDVVVRLKTLGGLWETVGVDRMAGIVPELTSDLIADEWGCSAASFSLHRDPGVTWPDLGAFADVEIDVGGVTRWDGRISQTPTADGDDPVVNVQCEGWRKHLEDDVYRRPYVKTRLSDFKDVRGIPGANLAAAAAIAGAQVTSDGNAVYLAIPNGVQVTPGAGAFASLDMGPGVGAKRVVCTWTSSNSSASVNIICRLANYPHNLDPSGTFEDAFGTNLGAGASGTNSGTVTTPRRYVKLYLYETTFTGASAPDHWWKITSMQIFTDTAYESGGVSVLKSPTIINDAISRATMLLSADRSGIVTDASVDFAFPEFDMDGQKNPREVIDAANAPLNYRAKIAIGRRMIFEPKPTAAAVEIGDWPGSQFEDTSSNSGDEIYNRVVVEGTAADGEQLSIRRSSSQQPGVVTTPISSPAPNNASFATDTTSWTASSGTAITRDTGVFDSSPASGRWDRGGGNLSSGDLLTETFTGTFQAGVTYALSGRIRGTVSGAEVVIHFGIPNVDEDLTVKALTTSFASFLMIWVPQTTVTNGQLLLDINDATKVYIDTLALAATQPTLVDRRGFVRAHVLPIRNSLTQALGEKIGDTWLAAHQTTPLKGTVKVTGDGGVREVLTGRNVAPEELLSRTGDLLRLSHRIDPDTGAVGRDGRIAEVRYNPSTDEAVVTLDSSRNSVDALLERLAIVVGSN